MTSNSVSGDTEIFFKNGVTFFKGDTESAKWFYKDGKIFYEFYKNQWRFFDTEGNQIISNFDNITDIKKIDQSKIFKYLNVWYNKRIKNNWEER